MYEATNPKPVIHDEDLHFINNGRVVCGACAGVSARYTGRDISGQEVVVIDAHVAALFKAQVGRAPKCEGCGRTA